MLLDFASFIVSPIELRGGVAEGNNLAERGEGESEAVPGVAAEKYDPEACGRLATEKRVTEGSGEASVGSVGRFGVKRLTTERSGWRFCLPRWGGQL
jgi:hypothetical protein